MNSQSAPESTPGHGGTVSPDERADRAAAHSAASYLVSKLIDVGSVLFKKQHPDVGARPGTLVIADDALPPKIRMISYDRQDVSDREITSVEELSAALDSNSVTWIDVQGFGDEERLRKIGEFFSIHPLAMEDVVNIPQRPKAENYDRQILIVTRMVQVQAPIDIDMEQLTLVLGENYVLTFQERYGDVLDPVRERIRNATGRMRFNGPDYLAYAIVDTIVDGYYPAIEVLGDHLEQLEQVVMEHPSVDVLRLLNRTKNMLVNLRRVIWPMREAVNSLVRRDESGRISDNVRTHLRDTYDHCVQTAEVIEMYREMATGLMNTYLSSVANRTNEVMKVLTIMASIFIPLTFLAGIYGMNFEHMPELHVKWAYPAVCLTMLGTAGGMLIYFWRKGWFRNSGGDENRWR